MAMSVSQRWGGGNKRGGQMTEIRLWFSRMIAEETVGQPSG